MELLKHVWIYKRSMRSAFFPGKTSRLLDLWGNSRYWYHSVWPTLFIDYKEICFNNIAQYETLPVPLHMDLYKRELHGFADPLFKFGQTEKHFIVSSYEKREY